VKPTNTGTSAPSRIPILTVFYNDFQWRNAVEDGALVCEALDVSTEAQRERAIRPLETVDQGATKTATPAAIVFQCPGKYKNGSPQRKRIRRSWVLCDSMSPQASGLNLQDATLPNRSGIS
jgi:hypothetical protein